MRESPNHYGEHFLNAPPRAAVMLEALRGLGYSTPSALADIIDNSIAAGASEVRVSFNYCGADSTVTVIDNGCGMDRDCLIRAMRLGVINPLEERRIQDLGRFGLGLKTASFSQCRRMTVASIRDNQMHSFRWDLDVLASAIDDGWRLLEGPFKDLGTILEPLESMPHGTAVIWNVLDRMVTPGFTEQDLLDLVDRVENHLSMVFHSFIAGQSPQITIFINDRPISAWDPFLLHHPATWSSPVATYQTPSGMVEVQCHVLPHRDRLSQREFDDTAGPGGWTAQQGFYIYRNSRLLVPGSWLNLGLGRSWTKEEAHKLARIRVDLPNTADQDWKIDVRKSSAVVPVQLRKNLARLADDTRRRARRVFANRGCAVSRNPKCTIEQAWYAQHDASGIRYRIDRNHYAVRSVLEQAGKLSDEVIAMIRVIEETVPVQKIWLNTAEGNDVPQTGFQTEAKSDLVAIMTILYRNMINRKGYSPQLAKDKLLSTEPFQMHPQLVNALPDQVD